MQVAQSIGAFTVMVRLYLFCEKRTIDPAEPITLPKRTAT